MSTEPRIGIVSDSLAPTLADFIRRQGSYRVAWSAANGLDALRQCSLDTPDLVLLDLFIGGGMDGVELTRHLMQTSPCPVLLLSRSLERDAGRVFDAMAEGALDVLNLSHSGNLLAPEDGLLLQKKLRTVTRFGRPAPTGRAAALDTLPRLVVIGSSTGGPKALTTVLTGLPAGLDAAVVIVQHLVREFSMNLTSWLDHQAHLPVHLAVEGSRPRPGHIYVAGSDDHLVLTPACQFAYTADPIDLPYRPSVDVFFSSVARHWPRPGTAALLTGMGRDGANGLAALRRAGWHTIAQDEASSIVYGMPKAAKELGAAVEVLALERIALAILQH